MTLSKMHLWSVLSIALCSKDRVSVGWMSVHVEQLLYCCSRFTRQLWIIIFFADFGFFTISLPGIIDLLDVGPGLQHLLQSAPDMLW